MAKTSDKLEALGRDGEDEDFLIDGGSLSSIIMVLLEIVLALCEEDKGKATKYLDRVAAQKANDYAAELEELKFGKN